MATQLEKLMFQIGLLDKVTGPAGKIQRALGNMADTAKHNFDKITDGTDVMSGAGAVLQGIAAPANDLNMALGEVRSLDVAQAGLDTLSDKAIQFSIKYGESSSDFVRSSYDIQSAITGLTGNELASFTEASNILAKGTKSDAATITDYMGTMYGIFKNSADAMGKAQWVNQLTGQTATAVKMFKTTGMEMAGAFTSLGASATSAGIAQSEQIAILGQLQATMSGSEAGTKYKAFLSGIGGAQEKLGLKFTDSQGRMLGIVDILGKIQGKFGDTLDVAESDALKKAFGSDEAVGMIQLLMADTAGLNKNISSLGQIKGLENAEKMAGNMVDPFQRWAQGIHAIRIGLGQALLPVLKPFIGNMVEGAGTIYNWTQRFPTLTRYVGYATIAVVGITGAVAAFGVAAGVVGLATLGYSKATVALKFAMGGLKAAFAGARATALMFNTALMANPVGMVAAGVAAGVGLIIYYWDDITAKFQDAAWFQTLTGWFERIGYTFKAMGAWLYDIGAKALKVAGMIFLFTTPLGWAITVIGTVIHNWDALKAAFLDLSWVKSIMGWINSVSAVLNAFGFETVIRTFIPFGNVIMDTLESMGAGFSQLVSWVWDFGGILANIGQKLFLFGTPLGWAVMAVQKLISNWDQLKATFMDSAWGQAIMGWFDKIMGKFQSLSGTFSWVKDKLSWIPGIDADPAQDVPKTSPYLEAPRRSTVTPGGAGQSIANAITHNSRTDSSTINIGQVTTSQSPRPHDFSNQVGMMA